MGKKGESFFFFGGGHKNPFNLRPLCLCCFMNLFLQIVRLLFVCCLTLLLCPTLSRLFLQVFDLPAKCAHTHKHTRMLKFVFCTLSIKALRLSFLTSAGTLWSVSWLCCISSLRFGTESGFPSGVHPLPGKTYTHTQSVSKYFLGMINPLVTWTMEWWGKNTSPLHDWSLSPPCL